jgi:polyisoprenoid-binding protein YceI
MMTMRTKLGVGVTVMVLALFGTAAPSAAQAQTWTIDSAHSAAQFGVRHMMVSTVRGHFNKMTGTVQWDGQSLAGAEVDITIDAASIDTREARRDDHLRSADFFDVATYPTITFKSSKIEPAGAGKLKMTGTLTMRGVSKPVVFDIEGPTPVIKAQNGMLRAGATASTTVNRKDFGLTWSRMMDGGGVVVGDEVSITVDVEITRK